MTSLRGLLKVVKSSVQSGRSSSKWMGTSPSKNPRTLPMSFYSCEKAPNHPQPPQTSDTTTTTSTPDTTTTTSTPNTTPTTEDCPVVFLHELFGSKDQWTSLSRRLHAATGRKTVAFDLRNHGDSRHSPLMTYRHLVADMLRALDDQSLDRVSLVGHRMGGRVAMSLAIDHPHRVKDLVVVDVSPRSADHNVFNVPVYLEAMLGARLRPNMTGSAARRSLAEQLNAAVKDPLYRDLLLDNVIQTENGQFKWRVNLVAVAFNFPEISMPVVNQGNQFFDGPTLFVTGTRYARAMKVERVDIRRTFSGAEFKAIEDINHLLHYKKEDDLLQSLSTFLSKQPPKK